MVVLMRQIQHIRPNKWADLEELDKEFDAIESRYGFPPKKRYRYISGRYDWSTLVVEREWESFAAGEAALEKALADPEYQALMAKSGEIIDSVLIEYLQRLD